MLSPQPLHFGSTIVQSPVDYVCPYEGWLLYAASLEYKRSLFFGWAHWVMVF